MNYVVKSSDGTLFGPFKELADAEHWAESNEEELGDWCVQEVHGG